MKRKLLPLLCAFFILGHFTVNAQATYQIECTMTIEEISLLQPFNVDHPKQENTQNICSVLFTELNLVYDKLNNGLTNELDDHLLAIQNAIDSAIAIEMNYSMFEADLNFIETIE